MQTNDNATIDATIDPDMYGIARELGLTDGNDRIRRTGDDDLAFRTGERLAERFVAGKDEFGFGAWLDARTKASEVLKACENYGTMAVMSQSMTVFMAMMIIDAMDKGGDEADKLIDRLVSIAYEDE